MPTPFSCTGGATVGWLNASTPLASLAATADALTISVRFLCSYRFAPDEVVSIERHRVWLFGDVGIRISHTRADLPERILFGALGSANQLLEGIGDSGFVPSAPSSAVPLRAGIPMRWSAVVIIVALWNALFLVDLVRSRGFPPLPGPFALTALGFVFVLSVATLNFPVVQRLILKPNRQIGEIQPSLRLLFFISGLMFVVFSILFFSGALDRFQRF